MFHSITIFLSDWYFSRSWGALARGVPSLLVGGAVLVIVGMGMGADEAQLIRQYDEWGTEAMAGKDYESAAVAYRKLRKLDDEEEKYQLALGLLAEEQEDLAEARRIIAPLAPLGEPGYAPAHIWMALDMVRENSQLDRERARVWERHLKLAVVAEPTHLQAHSILAEYYLALRQLELAAPHLAAVVDRRPDLRLKLAQVFAAIGETERARNQAQEASRYLARVVQQDDGNVEARLRWAAAETFLKRYDEAFTILSQGWQRWQDDKFRSAMAGVLVAWSDSVDEAQKYDKLQQALKLAPESVIVLQKLATLAGNDEQRDQIREQLEGLLAEGKFPEVCHFVLGTIATQEGNLDRASFHLEQAYQHNPKMVAVVNNLAWVLAKRDPPELDRALELANVAVQLAPGNGHILETRGMIHFQLEQWTNAITDLESALPHLAENAKLKAQVHEQLADAYEKIGQAEMAERHRVASRELRVES